MTEIDGYKIMMMAGGYEIADKTRYYVMWYDANGMIIQIYHPRTFVNAEKTYNKIVRNIMKRYK